MAEMKSVGFDADGQEVFEAPDGTYNVGENAAEAETNWLRSGGHRPETYRHAWGPITNG